MTNGEARTPASPIATDLADDRIGSGRPRPRHRGLHPAQLPRGPERGRLPATGRRGHHVPRGPGLRPGDDRRRGHRSDSPTRGRQLRLGRVPDQRRGAAGPGAGDRGDHHHQGRAGVLRAAPPRRTGPPRHRRRPRARAVLRPDGPQAPHRPGPRRLTDLHQPRLPGRHPRRPHLHQRHLRRRHQDQLRPVPAALHLSLRRPRHPGRQRQGAGVLGQGRGPAVPGLRQHPARRRTPAEPTPQLGLPAEPFASVGFYSPPTPDDLTGRPHVTGRTSGVDPFWWTLHEFCTGELLPYVFTDAEDERNQYTMVVSQVAARLRLDAHRAGKDGGVSIDGDHLPHLRRTRRRHHRTAHRRRHPPAVGRPRHRGGHDQRLHPPAPVVAETTQRPHPRRPARHRHPADLHRQPAGHRRRPAQPPRTGATIRRRRRAGRRDRPEGGVRARAACCSP